MCAKEVKRPPAMPAKMAACGSYAPFAAGQPSEPQPTDRNRKRSDRSAFHQPLFQLQRRRNALLHAQRSCAAAPHRSPASACEPHQSRAQSSFKVPWDRTTCTSCSPAPRRYPPLPQTPPQSRLRFCGERQPRQPRSPHSLSSSPLCHSRVFVTAFVKHVSLSECRFPFCGARSATQQLTPLPHGRGSGGVPQQAAGD